MSETETTPGKTTVNIRMTRTLLEELGATWTQLGYNSWSEFIRHVLRDALKHPEFDRADLKGTFAGEADIREGRTYSSGDVEREFSLDRDESSSE